MSNPSKEPSSTNGIPTSVAKFCVATEVGTPTISNPSSLLREKIVAQQSAAMVVVADDRKQVDCLGAFGIPIEITPFACDVTVSVLASMLNCNVELRMDGEAHVLTDNGNCIADARIGPTINDPIATEANILNVAGVVQVGLFNNMCDAVVLASGDGVQTLMNPKGRL